MVTYRRLFALAFTNSTIVSWKAVSAAKDELACVLCLFLEAEWNYEAASRQNREVTFYNVWIPAQRTLQRLAQGVRGEIP